MIFAVSGGGSNRARSDPTHQHHRHHPHPHGAPPPGGSGGSSQPLGGPGYSMMANSTMSMECESPGVQQARLQEMYRQQQQQAGGRSQVWQGGELHDRHGHHHHGHAHPQLQRHHSHPPSTSAGSVPGTAVPALPSHHGSHSGMVAPIAQTLLAGNMEPIVVAPPTRSQQHNPTMTIDLTSLPATVGLGGGGAVVETSQTGSVNMQLSGYHNPPPTQQPQNNQQTFVATGATQTFIATGAGAPGGFPFALPSGGGTSSEGGGASHSRTVGERGEESPMVGVCVQQSPVASH